MSLIYTKNGEISSSSEIVISAGVTGSLVLSSSYLILSESVAAPGTPIFSKGALYASGSDGFLYWKNSSGNVYNLTETGSGGSGTGSATELNDLTDVDLTTTAPGSGNVLSYDGTDWIPVTSSGGGTSNVDITELFDKKISQVDDFTGYLDGFSAYSSMGWYPAGTVTIAVQDSEAGHCGIYRFTGGSGASAVAGYRAGSLGYAAIFPGGSTRLIMETEIRLLEIPDATDDFIFDFGMSDDWGDGGSVTEGIQFRIDRTEDTTNWVTQTITSGTDTISGSSVAFTANTWYTLRIDVNAAADEVNFYIDNTLVTTHTANIPATSMSYGWLSRKVAGTVTVRFEIDTFTLTTDRGEVTTSGGGGGGGLSDGDYGDITVGGSGTTMTIDAEAVTLAKMANIATNTFIGRTTTGTGAPEALTTTQATENINVFTTSLKGLAPASGGGTTNFLRADGTWDAPPTGSGGTGSVSELDDLSDVDLTTTSPVSGNVLSFDGSNWIPTIVSGTSGSVSALDDLSDVDLTTVTPGSGNVLSYDGTDWIPITSSGGGGASTPTVPDPTANDQWIVEATQDYSGYFDAFSSTGPGHNVNTSGGSTARPSAEQGISDPISLRTAAGAASYIAFTSVGTTVMGGSKRSRLFQWRFKTDDVPNGTVDYRYRMGWADDLRHGGSIFNAIYLAVERAEHSTDFVGVCVDSATKTTASCGVAWAANTWYNAQIEVNAAGTTASFEVRAQGTSFSSKTDITSNVPVNTTAGMFRGFECSKVGGTGVRELILEGYQLYSKAS